MSHHVAVGALSGPRGLLLARRRADKSWYPSCWDFPGGHLEPGERAADALVRELREEIGAVAVVRGSPDMQVRERPDVPGGMVLDLWLITEWEGYPTNCAPEEHDEVRWFSPADALRLDLAHDSYRVFLAELDDSRRQG